MLKRAIQLVDAVGRLGRLLLAAGLILSGGTAFVAKYLTENDLVDGDEFEWYDPQSGQPVKDSLGVT